MNHIQQVEIRLKGQIDKNWSDQLGGLTMSYTANGETILTGTVRDYSALYGVLNRLPVLGFELISVATKTRNTQFSKAGGDRQTKRKLYRPRS